MKEREGFEGQDGRREGGKKRRGGFGGKGREGMYGGYESIRTITFEVSFKSLIRGKKETSARC